MSMNGRPACVPSLQKIRSEHQHLEVRVPYTSRATGVPAIFTSTVNIESVTVKPMAVIGEEDIPLAYAAICWYSVSILRASH